MHLLRNSTDKHNFYVLNVSHPDMISNSYKIQIPVKHNNPLIFKIYLRHHVSALYSHHQDI